MPRSLLRLLAGAAAAVLLWAGLVEPNRLIVTRTQVVVPSLRSGRPVLVAVLSDIHAGSPGLGLARLESIVETVNTERPDLVLLLGDYVIHGVLGGGYVEPEDTARVLGRLRGRLAVLAVLGNHDGWLDARRVRTALQEQGIPVLANEARELRDGDARLWVAGVEDAWTGRPDPGAALRAVPAQDPVILLTHNPDVFPDVPARVSLTLAGHTHGGQVRLPFLGRPIVPSRFGQRYAAGLIEEGGRRLYVTSGLGTSILPVRFGVPPEIALLELRAR